jgi:hypothetical protein
MRDTKSKGSKKKRNDAASGTVVDAAALHSPTDPADPEVAREFDEAKRLRGSGGRLLSRKLAEHHSQSPELTAGDIDAAWDHSDVGEESPGGTVSTPDQDVVEEIGEAVGLTFDDNEPIDGPRKLERRDRRRWELDPASAEDRREREKD